MCDQGIHMVKRKLVFVCVCVCNPLYPFSVLKFRNPRKSHTDRSRHLEGAGWAPSRRAGAPNVMSWGRAALLQWFGILNPPAHSSATNGVH